MRFLWLIGLMVAVALIEVGESIVDDEDLSDDDDSDCSADEEEEEPCGPTSEATTIGRCEPTCCTVSWPQTETPITTAAPGTTLKPPCETTTMARCEPTCCTVSWPQTETPIITASPGTTCTKKNPSCKTKKPHCKKDTRCKKEPKGQQQCPARTCG
ncbi:salivary glue protein Sgs-4-like [Drosophila subobscura]|uniref:salivary glue protein Sgs-4-like n=1 Tax=Drosophila subobscura TaxID=7241 RepID=UPI00155B0A49|nr:salivary glue protein Sgs-4-like [Drosophila subobscura]